MSHLNNISHSYIVATALMATSIVATFAYLQWYVHSLIVFFQHTL